jgi:hypothetical protein
VRIAGPNPDHTIAIEDWKSANLGRLWNPAVRIGGAAPVAVKDKTMVSAFHLISFQLSPAQRRAAVRANIEQSRRITVLFSEQKNRGVQYDT